MKLTPYSSDRSKEVVQLFTDVFSDSEGQEEVQVIGQLVTELIDTTDSNDLLGYLSISDDIIVGCIFFSRFILPSEKIAFILSPAAVSTRQQGLGLGKQLINYGIKQLQNHGVDLVFTYGDLVALNSASPERDRSLGLESNLPRALELNTFFGIL